MLTPLNYTRLTLAADYAAGSGTATVADASGLGSPSPGAAVILTAFRASAPTVPLFNARVEAVAGNVLTLAAITWGADTSLEDGDLLVATACAELFAELQALVAANAAAIVVLDAALGSKADDSAVVHKAGDETIAGTKTFTSTIDGNAATSSLAAVATALANTLGIAGGGTGATTAAGARTNLGLAIGTDVLAPTGDGSGLSGVALLAGSYADPAWITSLAGSKVSGVLHTTGDESAAGNKTFTGNLGVGQAASFPIQVWLNNGTAFRPFLEAEYEANRGALRFMAAGQGDTQVLTFLPRYSTGSALQTSTAALIFRVSSTEYQWGTGGSLNVSGFPLILTTQFANTTPLVVQGRASQTAALVRLQGISSTSTARDQAHVDAEWADSTDASRKGRLKLSAVDTAAREGIRVEASGSQALIGFFGATAVARPAVTGSRGGNAALASLLTQLASLGLITDSTTA